MDQQPRSATVTEQLASCALDLAVPAAAALATIAVFLMMLR